MCIFNFKHSASSGNKNKANKIDIKEINGFTFVEVILVMALISFLYIVTMKVIQHNLDQKVPVYVYNLYKNLDNESKLLTKKLIEDANGEISSESGTSGSNSNQKTLEEVLKKMDAKSYCEAFAKDANLIGNADCENSINNLETSEAENKNATYTCERTYSFNVNDDGTYKETFTPSYDTNLTQCKDNENFDDNISCNAKPTEKIANLMLDNTQNYHTYSCKKDETKDNNETSQDVVAFDIDDTKPDISKSLKTTNNIHLNFVTLKPGNNKYSITYNLAANVNQDAILPTDVFDKPIGCGCRNKSDTKGCTEILNWKVNNDCCKWAGYDKRFGMFAYTTRNLHDIKITSSITDKNECLYDITAYSCKLYTEQETVSKKVQMKSAPISIPSQILQYAKTRMTQDYVVNTEELKKTNISFKSYTIWNGSYNKPYTPKIEAITFSQTVFDFKDNKDFYKNYYNKWTNFFKNSGFDEISKAAITPDNPLEEGYVETTLDKTSSNINDYLAHFIYASIDIPFAKGTIGKNIFVFEQFGSKIIPVGYLANNQNTPLKFNVITRNQDSFKIEKANYKNGMEKRPLTFCEAMKYTGEKFSQYCGCKDANGKTVTQYPKMTSCDNKFGCIIKPVKPSQVTPKFKLF